mmetsp:Transcript_16288/g.37260  ORF Transcript_16288/g.37260 Transcript_16288/m.37260 type:complete len:285 (+) Transcript_16288:211-1065(+)
MQRPVAGCTPLLEIVGDPMQDVLAGGDGRVRLRFDEHLLIGLHEEGDRVARRRRRHALGGRRQPHAVQVRVQPPVGPAREHVTNVHSNAAFHRVDCHPAAVDAAGRVRVGRALQPRLARALEEERHAVPVRVRARAPHRRRARLVWVVCLCRRVVQHPQGALAAGAPQVVRARERARIDLRAGAAFEEREHPRGELVRFVDQRARRALEASGVTGPAAVHRGRACGDLQRLLLVRCARRGADLRLVLVARVHPRREGRLYVLGALGLREELARRAKRLVDQCGG